MSPRKRSRSRTDEELERYEDEVIRKVPSKPIPETHYDRFKYRLEELSGRWAERNLTLFMLAVATGYRLGDLIELTVADIKEALDNGYFNIQEKKQYEAWLTHRRNNPQSAKRPPPKRKHDIEPKLESVLRKYIKGKKKSEYAFPSQKGRGSQHIQQQTYSDILKRVAKDKEIKLENITGHSLRKTYARRLYEAERSVEFVQKALGHTIKEVTERYLGLENDVKETAAKIAAMRL